MVKGGQGAIEPFSVVAGGPTYRLECALGLERNDNRSVVRKALAFLMVAWVPIVALAGIRWWQIGDPGRPFAQIGMHCSMLLGVPLLYVGSRMLHLRSQHIMARFQRDRFAGPDHDALPGILRAAVRIRDTVWVELLVVVLVVGWIAWMPPAYGSERAVEQEQSLRAARFWFDWVSAPLQRFLVVRAFAQWCVWGWIMWKLSRLHVQVAPTHPDLVGGLGFLVMPCMAMAPVAASLSISASGKWADRMLWGGAKLATLAPPVAMFTLIMLAVVLGPLMFFGPALHRTRIRGRAEYGSLALDYTRRFHRRWIQEKDPDSLLGSADIQSLADLGQAHSIVNDMRVTLFSLRTVVWLLVFSLAPLVPLLFLDMPVVEVTRKLLGAFAGRLPG